MKPPFAVGRATSVRFVLMAWALPAVLSYLLYFAFTNTYSGNAFNADGFAAIYDNGIFKYRILGINLLRATHDAIVALGLPTSLPPAYLVQFPNTTPEWYSAFFYLNTVVLGMTMSVFFVIAEKLNVTKQSFLTDLCLIVLLGIMIFSQYVIVPYDMLSYLFLALAMYLVLFRSGRIDTLVYLCAVIILGTLTRETAALILSFYAAVNFKDLIKIPPRFFDTSGERPSPLLTLALLTVCFLGTYVALRLNIETHQPFFKGVRVAYNLADQFSVFGMIYFVVASAALLTAPAARNTVALFMIAAAPYIVGMIMIANPREIRLWAPVLMPMFLLQFQAAMENLMVQKH